MLRQASPACLAMAALLSFLWPAAAGADPGPVPDDLPSYLRSRDDFYGWEEVATHSVEGAQVSVLHLYSQIWQGIPWEHWLGVIRPQQVTHPEHALLVITGGSVRKEPPDQASREVTILAGVAAKTGTVIAVLGQVPNQPLFGGRKEDDLIAHTFEQYFKTGDETWPGRRGRAHGHGRGRAPRR